jgi:hypothetical protein
MLTTLITLSIIAGLFIIASIVDRLLLHSILFPTMVSRAIKGQRHVSEYLDSLAMLDGPYVVGHAFDDLMRGHIKLVSSSSSRHSVTVKPSINTFAQR